MWSKVMFSVLLIALSGAPLPAASDGLRVTLGPLISFEPGTVRVTAFLEPNQNNRRLIIEADSGDHFTSSDLPLDGERQPRATSVWLKNLPAGKYELNVRVAHGRGPDLMEHRGFEVLGTKP